MIRDHQTFIVICRDRSGTEYIVERNLADCDKASTVKAIARGEFIVPVVQVLELNPVEGWSRDISEDIAMEVCTIWANNGEPLDRWQRDFVESFVGLSASAAFPREREMV